MKILVVDDVAYMRMILSSALVMHCGYEKDNIKEASGGRDAVQKYKAEKPDIVFCDILMPDINGIDVVKELIALDPDAKIIMFTSESEAETVIDCIHAGAKDYLVKPPSPTRLKQSIEKVLKIAPLAEAQDTAEA